MTETEFKHDDNLCELATYLFTTFDPHFLNVAARMARDLELQTGFVIERLALAHMAELAAEETLAGGTIPKLMPEFAPGMTATQFYDSWLSNKVKQARADETLAKRMTELNQYLLPGEKPANIETLKRRRDKAEFLKNHPGKEDVYDKAEVRQRGYEANRKAK